MIKPVRFDTRDRKPKLYGLIVLTAAAAAVIAVLLAVNQPGNAGAVCVTAAVYGALAVCCLIYYAVEQIRYNPYSYNTIFYIGFALFAFSVTVTYIVLSVKTIQHPELYSYTQIIMTLLESAKNYMILSAPFLLIFSAALCVSNIALLRRAKKRVNNLLGIALSALIVGGEVFIFTFDFSASGSLTEVMIHDLITNLFAAVFLYSECMMLSTSAAGAIAAGYEPDRDRDYIIILGCGLNKDGTPSPVLAGRIDRALAFWKKQKEETGKEAFFVTSGGQGSDEPVPESASMRIYLEERGVPGEKIIEEDKSTSTLENMKYSREKIISLNPDAKIAFSTTNYHVFRSGLCARRVKMRAVGMGSGSGWYFWPNAAVREFAGLLANHRVKQAVILGSMTAFYVVLTVIVYNHLL